MELERLRKCCICGAHFWPSQDGEWYCQKPSCVEIYCYREDKLLGVTDPQQIDAIKRASQFGDPRMPRRWINLSDLASRRQPTQRESDKYGVNRKRPQPPRVGRGDDRLREDDRPDDRYDERDPDGENDE